MTEKEEPFLIPLAIKGITSHIPTHKLMMSKFENTPLCNQYNLTNSEVKWDPMMTHFKEQEEAMLGANGHI